MEHFVFLEAERDLATAFETSYSPLLVILSIFIAALASYTAFLISERISANEKGERQIRWGVMGSLALGLGVWSMHFIGMLALQMPVNVNYDIGITLLSLFPVVLASLVVLYNGLGENSIRQLLTRSVIMGSGIGAMHYIGMSAMNMDAVMRYSPGMVLLSVGVAVSLAFASLYFKFWMDYSRRDGSLKYARLIAALTMGGCVSTMHYTGMAAVSFFPAAATETLEMTLEATTLAEIIGGMVVVFLGLLMAFTVLATRLTLLNQIKEGNERMRAIVDNVGEAIITINERGIVQDFNKGAETIFGYCAEEVIGQNVHMLMPEPDHSQHDTYIRNYIATGEAKVVGKSRNVSAQRKDGEIITVEFTLSELKLGDRRWFTGLLRDVTEKLRMDEELEAHRNHLESLVEERTKELVAARNMALDASKSKSQFLANMSHELRTPMNSIIGFTGRVIKKSSDVLPERQLKNLHTVERNAHHLLSLINSLLDLSKIEAGKMELFLESFRVNSLVNEVADLTESLFSTKRVQLEVSPLLHDVMLYSDKMKLKQILINLVGNSAKFTEEGSVKIIVTSPDADFISISVSDTGVGMSQDEAQNIFDAFHQVDGSLTRKVGGTGLGLAVTRSFVELLGGKIMVESLKDQGTTMTVTVPVGNSGTVENKAEDGIVLHDGNGLVLCIDDDEEALELLRGYLEDGEFNVVTASNGLEGLEKAEKYLPMAITLDVHMPKIDGWEVLEQLKKTEATKDIPVIMVTMMDNIALGYELGAGAFIQKPISSEMLLESIGRLTSQSISYVLAVDDEPEVLELNRQILGDEGIDVGFASNGVEALESMTQKKPDVVLLDLMMPEMDGFEVVQRMRSDDEWKHIPVVVMTAKTLSEEERTSLSKSVESIITKEGVTAGKILKEISLALNTQKELADA